MEFALHFICVLQIIFNQTRHKIKLLVKKKIQTTNRPTGSPRATRVYKLPINGRRVKNSVQMIMLLSKFGPNLRHLDLRY